MDRRLSDSLTRGGDVPSLKHLIQQDQSILKQTTPGSLNTILHLAARFGHLAYAEEVARVAPELAAAENAELETPLHEACREGHLEVVKLLAEKDPWVAYRVNCRGQSGLFAACERGKVDVVRILMGFPAMMVLEADMETTSLHVAAASGNTEIVKEIIKARPDFAWKKNRHGRTPLHLACSKGHLDTTRELSKLDSDLFSVQDNQGRTPLHCAAIKGRINVLDEILCVGLELFEATTHAGETVLHLAVKNNQYEAVKYLTEMLDISKLLNVQDDDGNTVLHLAAAGKLTTMAMYLLKIGIEVNSLNKKGYTALDVVEADAANSAIVPVLQEAGAKRCDQLSLGLIDIQQQPRPTSKSTKHSPHSRPNRSPRRRWKLEGLKDTQKTTTIVAVLIATMTFSAGINPPGGFSQESGKAVAASRTAFKVFMASNVVALFLSVGVVNVHVNIVPFMRRFTRRTMMVLLEVTRKVMWASMMFMTWGYIAAVWTIMPARRGGRWVAVEVLVVGGGCSTAVFLGLTWLIVRHLRNESRWKRERGG